mgnify:CR=1 FL=1
MKGEVINTFRDKFHYNTIYEVGTVVDFDKERMKDLIARGLCKKVDEKPSAKKDDKEKSLQTQSQRLMRKPRRRYSLTQR